MKKNQGSALAIAVFVLSIALVGAIGFIFWQNYITKPVADVDSNNSQDIDSDNNDEIVLANVLTDQTFDTNLSVRYPSDWTKTTTSSVKEGLGMWSSTIVSPNGKVKIYFNVGSGGVGGNCDPSDGTIESIDLDEISNYPNAVFLSTVTTNVWSNGYKYYMGVSNNGDGKSSISVGGDYCSVAALANILKIDSEGKILQLYAEFTDVINDSTTTKNAFEQIKGTENYNTAKAIIQSLYVK